MNVYVVKLPFLPAASRGIHLAVLVLLCNRAMSQITFNDTRLLTTPNCSALQRINKWLGRV
jgi:hypothetical protein